MSASGAKEEMPPVPEGAESLDVRTLEQELTDDLFLHILAEDGGPPITHLLLDPAGSEVSRPKLSTSAMMHVPTLCPDLMVLTVGRLAFGPSFLKKLAKELPRLEVMRMGGQDVPFEVHEEAIHRRAVRRSMSQQMMAEAPTVLDLRQWDVEKLGNLTDDSFIAALSSSLEEIHIEDSEGLFPERITPRGVLSIAGRCPYLRKLSWTGEYDVAMSIGVSDYVFKKVCRSLPHLQCALSNGAPFSWEESAPSPEKSRLSPRPLRSPR